MWQCKDEISVNNKITYSTTTIPAWAMIVAGDVYVHADLHGASSVIIKNHTGTALKCLNSAV